MIDKLKLGIVYNKKGMIVNHRSLVKVLCNPFFRLFGFHLGTVYNIDENTLHKPRFMKTKRMASCFEYDLPKGCSIKKERTLI